MGIKRDSIGITGADGFIGKHLISHLKRKRIKYSVFSGDLLKKNDLKTYFRKYNPIIVIHLAGQFSGTANELTMANAQTTKNILEIGASFGLRKIIYTSTGAVYGKPQHTTGSKESDLPKPNTTYGKSKFQAENYILKYNLLKGISYVILRFPSVYGTENTKGVIYEMLRDIKKHKIINIFGGGIQTRQFLDVIDACNIITLSLENNVAGIWNIAPKTLYSISQIASLLKKQYKFEIKYLKGNNKLTHMYLDISKSKKQFGRITDRLQEYLANRIGYNNIF